jgi:hypothetical protein
MTDNPLASRFVGGSGITAAEFFVRTPPLFYCADRPAVIASVLRVSLCGDDDGRVARNRPAMIQNGPVSVLRSTSTMRTSEPNAACHVSQIVFEISNMFYGSPDPP